MHYRYHCTFPALPGADAGIKGGGGGGGGAEVDTDRRGCGVNEILSDIST